MIRAAGVRDELSFTSFRHGGFTEGGDAELTDREMLERGGEIPGRGPVLRSIRLAVMRFPVISDGVYRAVTIVLLFRVSLFNAGNQATPHELRHFIL